MKRSQAQHHRPAGSPDRQALEASKADQAASDADQLAADQDELSASRDQRAADQDQSTAEVRDLVTALDAYERSKEAREASSVSRKSSKAARTRSAVIRAQAASERNLLAAARDKSARRRDARAEAIEHSITDSDALPDEKLVHLLARSAAARNRSAAERNLAARDRADDAYERSRMEAERTSLEGELRQAQKMEGIGRLAGGIAHDFNNLLTAIRGNASLALAGLPLDHPVREDLELIEQAADRAAALTRQLLAFARRTVLQPQVVDLGSIVEHLEPLLRRLIGEDIDLVIKGSPGASSVLADPNQIEQVIVNVVVNARDAMPDGGALTIEVAADESASHPMATLSVRDTGVGMDPETLDRIFEPFFTTKDPGMGTGLGLATVYGIVNQSGGTVSALSEPGRGSTFTVQLPCADSSAQLPLPRPGPAVLSGWRTGTILVVEDDAGVRRFASRALEAAGYSVVTAPDGAAAIETARNMTLKLLITDVVMPGLSGREVAQRLAATHLGLRVLYMSGHPDKRIARDGGLDPGIDFLPKPFTTEELLRAVDGAVGHAIEH